MNKKIILIFFFISYSYMLSAQLSTFGTTGLLHAPSAEMQADKTLMIGGNFLHKEITPDRFDYNTLNYFVNVTILPFLEVTYVCTLFKTQRPHLGLYKKRFREQDRHFGVRLRVWEESKYIPSIVLGTSDPFSRSTKEFNSETSNGYFCRFFIATTKHFDLGSEQIGVHLSFLHNRRQDYKMKGIAGGVTYAPSFTPDLTLIAEYDTRDVAVGATYLLFKRIQFQAELQRFKYFSGGLTFKIPLK